MGAPGVVACAGMFVLPRLGASYLRFVNATTRLRRAGFETVLPDDGGPIIYAFWHAELAMMPWMQLRPPTACAVSRSRDGEITARLFALLRVLPVRGSSSRGGAGAARALVAAIGAGNDVGFTLDGPRGPAGVVQPGATWLARATGRPLVPVRFDCTRQRRLRTWDRMLLPLPFGRGVFVYGDHLWVPSDADNSMLRQADASLSCRLEQLAEQAAAMLLT